jgi:hypothetical protein
MYKGEKERGTKMARQIMYNMVCRQGWSWDMPILYRGDSGEGIWGNDYGQMMICWALPAAVLGKNITEICKPGEFIDRVIKAGQL